MFGCMAVALAIRVSVEKKFTRFVTRKSNAGKLATAFLLITGLPMLILVSTAYAAINVSFSTAAPVNIQNDVVANLTSYFNASVAVTPSFPSNRNLIVYGKNQAIPPATVCPSTTTDPTTNPPCMVYVYGYVAGISYERATDISIASDFGWFCSTPTAFDFRGSSSATWDVNTCQVTVNSIRNGLYQQNFSTPTLVPGF